MRCCGCNGEFADSCGPTHAYMLSSPGCWVAYGAVLAREYEDTAYREVHRLTVDTYAVQHPGVDTPRARNSVGIHLARLALVLGRGWPIEHANDAMLAITAKKKNYPWLTPPTLRGELTVKDVLRASDAMEHEVAVKRWSRSTWQAWSAHHATVFSWVEDLRNKKPQN